MNMNNIFDLSHSIIEMDNSSNLNFSNSIIDMSQMFNLTQIQNSINEEVSRIENLQNKPLYKNILNESAENIILKDFLFSYKNSSKLNESCPILLVDFEPDDEIIQLPCDHCFDKASIIKWFKTESTLCPVCRTELPEKMIKKEKIDTPVVSRDDITRSVRTRYLNEINYIMEMEAELQLQRTLISHYSNS